ncbi:MAG TPA: hypothetical protein VGL60_04035 [Acidimicrobiales bacterium]|jgi:hypothetical protein
MGSVDLSTYVVTDAFFGPPYVDTDEERAESSPHRYVHGGFEGTDTRFAFSFPPAEQYEGRLYQPLEGANAGHEDTFGGPMGSLIGGLDMVARLGGYMVESNMGHIGDVMDPKAGPDPTIYGWRAAAESARLSKFVAEQVYGAPPSYAYVFGGSGGARRSPLCLAYAPGIWDAALPFMGDAMDGDFGDLRPLSNGAPHFSAMFNVQRLLGPRIVDVVDAMSPGGSADPFGGLDAHQREELAALYRLGYPRGDEEMIAQPMGQIWLWASMAERLVSHDASYFEAFWNEPGYVGHDQPRAVEGDVIDVHVRVKRVVRASEIVRDPAFRAPEFRSFRGMAALFAQAADPALAVELEGVGDGYRLGAGVRILSGAAAGRQLYCISGVGDLLLCDGEGEASNQRFDGVVAGDEVHVTNRDFLAYCYYYRHHIRDTPEYDFLRLDGNPIYTQHAPLEMSPFMGVLHTGRFDGKMLWVHHTHDASLWPSQGTGMLRNVEREVGPQEAARRFRLRWTENAEHVPPVMTASGPRRASTTWLVDYQPVIEQSLVDLAAWVEQGVEPAGTTFELVDGRIVLPRSAPERGGIQPVVTVRANGAERAEVLVGEPVSLEVVAEVPAGAGTIIGVRWDFDGSGSYPFAPEVDGSQAAVTLTTRHTYDRPGTYFATALVESHRQGDTRATARRIPNLAAARVVVR